MFSPEEVVSYLDMRREKEVSLQRGMNYRSRGGVGIILMSRRKGAQYGTCAFSKPDPRER
jgi:hypothetical protein